MSFTYKLLSSFLVMGLALTLAPTVTTLANTSSAEDSFRNSIYTASQNSGRPTLSAELTKNGWGTQPSQSLLTSDSTRTSSSLSSAKLQAVTNNYTCSANYFASSPISYLNGLATDGVGNTYSSGYDNENNINKFSRINSGGTVTTINVSSDYFLGNIVANSAGDAFQIAYDNSIGAGNYKISKVSAGTSNYTLIYTLSGDKFVQSNGLEIDSSGNLYIGYETNLGTIAKIEKISSTGTLLSTYTLPSITTYGTDRYFNLNDLTVSPAGLMFVPVVSYTPSINNLSVLILNTNGTKKADYQYSSDVNPTTYTAITALPSSVAGGGVYVSYYLRSNGNLLFKRILDTDNAPISTTPTYTAIGSTNVYYTNEIITESDNSNIYFQVDGELRKLKTSNSTVEYVVPYTNPFGTSNLARNSSNQIIFGIGNGEIYKLDCATPYTPTTIGIANISSDFPYCVQNSTGLAESSTYYCGFTLQKGLSFVMPTELRIQISGSSSSYLGCYVFNLNLLSCPSIPLTGINTTTSKNVQVSINGGSYSTVTTVISWQPFGSWSPNSITLAGKTEELVVGSKLYQAGWGTDNGLYLRSMDTTGNFGNWSRLGSITIKGTPTLSVDPNGDLYVFAHGTDNGLYFWKSGEVGGERWRRSGAITLKDKVNLQIFNGKYWLYATGTDNGSYVAKFSSFSATSYTNPAWVKAGNITVNTEVHVAVLNSRIYQIAIGTDNGLYTRSADNSEVFGAWSRFDSFEYNKLSKPVVNASKLAISASSKGINNTYSTTDFTGQYPYLSRSLDSNLPTNFSVFASALVEAGYGVDGRLYHRNVNVDNYYSLSSDWMQGNNITIKDAPTSIAFNNKQYQFVRGSDNKLWTRSRS